MATIKVKFRTSSVEMKEGSLYYQVIHNRLARQVHTGYKLFLRNGMSAFPRSCWIPARQGDTGITCSP